MCTVAQVKYEGGGHRHHPPLPPPPAPQSIAGAAGTPHHTNLARYVDADKLWLQPPGHVHAMIHDAWQPLHADVEINSTLGCFAELQACLSSRGQPSLCCHESASAAISDDGSALTVRYVNPTNQTISVTITPPTSGSAGEWGPIDIVTLSSLDLDDGNPATNVSKISPHRRSLAASEFVAPAQSFAVLRFSRAGARQ